MGGGQYGGRAGGAPSGTLDAGAEAPIMVLRVGLGISAARPARHRKVSAPRSDDAPRAASAHRLPMHAWRIVTRARSVYLVVRCGDRWWAAARERGCPAERALQPGLWAIEPPSSWPPTVGATVRIRSLRSLQGGHPHRIPGSGARRVSVVATEALTPPVAARYAAVWFEAAGRP